jgi:hypothetical protein
MKDVFFIERYDSIQKEFFNFGIVVIGVHDNHAITCGDFQNDNVRIVPETNEGFKFFFG